ncbi:BLUF domain-containing protein [Cytophagaceae bacterium YF14B1]|uniref:BLUF domain-containing protein n=1 Tax=Xanthocytophaga flava TaxID=3048013 RepID=A0AAE3QNW0_9BACT|nr:BLUF domain-containing protein [Xanthocytophaga flavus]MDJ1480860.1 BLUF domain-containing protein [Xanthocytophaga flavus]
MLSSLMYVSKRSANCHQEEVIDIFRSSERNNKKANITGILLYSDTLFIHYLEGDFDQINQLYDKIKTDYRHKHIFIIEIIPVKERKFPDHPMIIRSFNLQNSIFWHLLDNEDAKSLQSILEQYSQTGDKILSMIERILYLH